MPQPSSKLRQLNSNRCESSEDSEENSKKLRWSCRFRRRVLDFRFPRRCVPIVRPSRACTEKGKRGSDEGSRFPSKRRAGSPDRHSPKCHSVRLQLAQRPRTGTRTDPVQSRACRINRPTGPVHNKKSQKGLAMSEKWGISRVGKLELEVGETLQEAIIRLQILPLPPCLDGLLPAYGSRATRTARRWTRREIDPREPTGRALCRRYRCAAR